MKIERIIENSEVFGIVRKDTVFNDYKIPKNPLKTIKILNKHGIKTTIINGKLWVIDSFTQYGLFFEEWININNWDKYKIYTWLGY